MINWEYDIEEYEYNKRTILIGLNSNSYFAGFLTYDNSYYKNNKELRLLLKDNTYSFKYFYPISSLDKLKNQKIKLKPNPSDDNKIDLFTLKEIYNVLVLGIDITKEEILDNPDYYIKMCSIH
jgi:hypothetical protein